MSLSLAATAFQKAIVSRLNGDTELTQMLTGIYDFVPEKTAFPYVSLSTLQARDVSSRSLGVSEVTMELSIWSVYRGKQECLNIAHVIEELLTKASLVMDDGAIVTFNISSKNHDVLNDGATRRCRLRYQAVIQEDAA